MNDEQLTKVATDTRKACIKYYGDKKPLIQNYLRLFARELCRMV